MRGEVGFDTGRSWVHRKRSSDFSALHELAVSRGLLVVVLDGARMRSLDGLFGEYRREFSFPSYFGRNWSAFHECMTGLEWLPASGYVTLISRAEEVLAESREDLEVFMRYLGEFGQTWARSFALGPEWGGGEVPFHTVLMSDAAP